jgi:hypothetical protein
VVTIPHRHRSFAISGWTCTASACGKIQEIGVDPSPFTRQQLVLLWFLIPPGTVTITHDLVPVVSLTAHGLSELITRTRLLLEPQGWTILRSKGVGCALVRLPGEVGTMTRQDDGIEQSEKVSGDE